ncbi:hypothetical protein AVEN_39018-1 [Araneus ventricosus]|uniref:Uncharacterized protein n=1 Tax=Araneus ventricosus TaxID=182803 RepID=A0A4Y2DRL6_ARAVE|nr:hypothetical protein AVEN_39018-1 [Araneus ventricosus]
MKEFSISGKSGALYSAQMAWSATHFLVYPFRLVIHAICVECKSIHYGPIRFPTAPASPPPVPISSRAREPHPSSPTFLYRSHFSIYGQTVQMERLDIQTSDHTATILIGFSYRRSFFAWICRIYEQWSAR